MAEVPPPSYAHYPRPDLPGGNPTSPYSRPPGVYFDVLGDAWKMVTSELGTWVLATIFYGLLSVVLIAVSLALQIMIVHGGSFEAMIANGQAPMPEYLRTQLSSTLVSIVPSTLVSVLFFGLANMAVRKAEGYALSPGDIFIPFRKIGTVFLTLLLTTISMMLGVVACIVPFFYLMGALSLAPLIAMNQPVGPVEALKMSARALGAQAWILVLVYMLGSIFCMFGMIACGVGLLVTIPIFAAIYGLHYHYFFPPIPRPYVPTPDVPSSY
jgi:uncharacterized membrane protein